MIAAEHSERLYIIVGDSSPIHFKQAKKSARVVLEGLRLSETYPVKVFFDDKVVKSWTLNFSELGSNKATIWRSKGSFHMGTGFALNCISPNT